MDKLYKFFKKKRGYLSLVFLILLFIGLSYFAYIIFVPKINGVFLLSENTGDISGYYKWIEVLDKKGLKAIIKPERSVLQKYPEYFRQLADKGYEVATGYGEAPFWDMPYGKQYQIMKEYKEYAEKITGKPVRIFSSKYFAYDENTLKAADALGIPYVLGRGTGIKAVIYSPNEYNAKIILVSNLEFEDMGSGSLCDASLYQRGSTPDDFRKVLGESFAEKPKDLILVSHVYIGGTRVGWWNAYEEVINSKKVNWKNFDDWMEKADKQVLPYKQIPYNTEVKYVVPKPAVPLEDIEVIPELKDRSLHVFHNGQGPMCLDFLEFAKTLTYPIEQHLTTDSDFGSQLEVYKTKFTKSDGVDQNFGYYPIIFMGDKAYSGFNDNIKQEILNQIFK